MADSHVLQGSANTRSNSRTLAESLTNIVESCNESYTLDESISVIGESTPETDIAAGERKIFEAVVNDLNSISGEEVINNLVKQFSLKRLTHLRDVSKELCCETWKDCPTGKLVRRLARKGGAKVETKMATDIVELLKFWKSGEITQQLIDMFVKGNSTKFELSQAFEDGSRSGEALNEFVPKMVEKLEADFSRASFEMKSFMNELKCEVESLSGKLLQRDAKICELESKLTSLESRRKVELERQRSKYDDYELEINVLKKQMSGLTKDIESLKSKIQKINGPGTVAPGGLERTKAGAQSNNGASSQHTTSAVRSASNESKITSITNNLNKTATSNTQNRMEPSLAEVVASTTSLAAQSSQSDQLISEPLILEPKNDSVELAQTVDLSSDSSRSKLEIQHPDVEFVGVRKLNIKRVYLGGVKEGVNEGKIREFMDNKGVVPTFIRTFKSRRKGTIAVRVNVKFEDYDRVCKNEFWPTNVYARPWISASKWGNRDTKRPDRQSSQHQDESN